MRITLPACAHAKVLTYKVTKLPGQSKTLNRGMCESCFMRVVRFSDEPRWSNDKPAGGDPCPHRNTQIVHSKLTANKPYKNAVCNECGAGLRAKNGTTDWKPLREYRFIIEEHP